MTITQLSTLGTAMVTCGKDGSNLVDIPDCTKLGQLKDSLVVAGKPSGKTYMIGTLANHDDPMATRYVPTVDKLIMG